MALKIYFCGSITAGRGDQPIYKKIIKYLKEFGTVLTEHVGYSDEQLSTFKGLYTYEVLSDVDKKIHDQSISWLKEANVLIAEVTTPSLGVGYEIGRAVEMNKPVLCLFRPSSGNKISTMISGAIHGPTFFVENYENDGFKQIIKDFLQTLASQHETLLL